MFFVNKVTFTPNQTLANMIKPKKLTNDMPYYLCEPFHEKTSLSSRLMRSNSEDPSLSHKLAGAIKYYNIILYGQP